MLNQLVNRRNKRNRSKSRSRSGRSKRRRVTSRTRSISRSRSRERDQHHHHRNQHEVRSRSLGRRIDQHGKRSRSREREQQTTTAPSNFIDNETIARLRQKHPTTTKFAINLMQKLFTMDELTVKNVNVEGRARKGYKVPVVALSPTRVAELKRLSLENVAIDERESVWRECRQICNSKLSKLRKMKEEEANNHNNNTNVSRSRSRVSDEEQTTTAASSSSNFIDAETIASLRKQHPTTTAFAVNLMLKLFTMDELTVKNVNLEGKTVSSSTVPVIALSPTRVAELKRHCLENVAINERKSVWRGCKRACNNKLFWLKKIKENENRQMMMNHE